MAFGDLLDTAVNDGTGTAVEATFDTGTRDANDLIVAIAFTGDVPLSPNGTLVEDIDHHDTGQNDGFSIGSRVIQGGDGNTWGFTQPSSDQFAIIIRQYDGDFASSPLDQTGTTAFAANPATQSVTTGGATSQDDELVVAAWGFRKVGTLTISSPTNGFGNLLQEHQDPGGFQKSVGTTDKVLTATDTPSTQVSFSDTTDTRSGALIATYKKAAAAGGSTSHIHLPLLGVG